MKNIIYFFLLFLILQSCQAPRYVYGPSAHNIPVLTKKHDAKLAVNYSSSLIGERTINGIPQDEKVRGVDIHSAYAVTNKLAVQINYYNRNERQSPYGIFDGQDSGRITYKRNFTEAAFGYFKMNDQNADILQIFIGIGKGTTTVADNGVTGNGVPYARFLSTDVTRLYLQPAVIMKSKKRLVFSLSSRVSFVKFSDTKTSYDSVQKMHYGLNDLYTNTYVFWEPAIIASYGFNAVPGLRVESQFGFSRLLSASDTRFRRSNFSIGVMYNFRQLFKQRAD